MKKLWIKGCCMQAGEDCADKMEYVTRIGAKGI